MNDGPPQGLTLKRLHPLVACFHMGPRGWISFMECNFVFVHSFFNLFYSGIETPDQNGQWYRFHMGPRGWISFMECNFVLCILFLIFFILVWTRQIKTVNGTSISKLYLPSFFFTRAIPKGLTFGLCLYVLCLYNVHVLYCIPGSSNAYYILLESDLNYVVKSPEVTLCG